MSLGELLRDEVERVRAPGRVARRARPSRRRTPRCLPGDGRGRDRAQGGRRSDRLRVGVTWRIGNQPAYRPFRFRGVNPRPAAHRRNETSETLDNIRSGEHQSRY
jgi:hypothetical protein